MNEGLTNLETTIKEAFAHPESDSSSLLNGLTNDEQALPVWSLSTIQLFSDISELFCPF